MCRRSRGRSIRGRSAAVQLGRSTRGACLAADPTSPTAAGYPRQRGRGRESFGRIEYTERVEHQSSICVAASAPTPLSVTQRLVSGRRGRASVGLGAMAAERGSVACESRRASWRRSEPPSGRLPTGRCPADHPSRKLTRIRTAAKIENAFAFAGSVYIYGSEFRRQHGLKRRRSCAQSPKPSRILLNMTSSPAGAADPAQSTELYRWGSYPLSIRTLSPPCFPV
jgi:hypothetical protein